MIDEYTRECLAIRVARCLNSNHVLEVLGDCMLTRRVPEHVRSDNGAEMTAWRVKLWLQTVGTQPLYIEPDSPWANGYCESFNGKLRDECLNGVNTRYLAVLENRRNRISPLECAAPRRGHVSNSRPSISSTYGTPRL